MTAVRFESIGLMGDELAILYRQEEGLMGRTVTASIWSFVANVKDLRSDLEDEEELCFDSMSPYSFEIDNLLSFEVPEVMRADKMTSATREDYQILQGQKSRKRWDKAYGRLEAQQDFVRRMKEAKTKKRSRKDVSVQFDKMLSWESFTLDVLRDSSPLMRCFIVDCVKNSMRSRPEYSKQVWELGWILYLTSAKTYALLRQVFILPSVSGLYDRFGQKLSSVKEKITDLSCVKESLRQVQKAADKLGSSVQYTLAIDAFALRTFAATKLGTVAQAEKGVNADSIQMNNGFLFLLVPHDYRIPIKMLHLAAAPNGSYNAKIDGMAKVILSTARDVGTKIVCQATDGDPGVSRSHESFYSSHVFKYSGHYGNLITHIWQWVSNDENAIIPIADPLHVWKNVRSRLISHKICLFDGSNPIDINIIRGILDIGDALDDVTQVGKMRDGYVLKLFTFSNVTKLLQAHEYVAAFLLFPFASWILVVFSPHISYQFRLFLCELAFQLLSSYLHEFDTLQVCGVQQKPTDRHSPSTFSKAHSVKRMLNTLACFGAILFFGADKLRMDCLGTHLVENAIGIARSTSFDPRYERVLTTFSHNELRKELAMKYSLQLHVPTRINKGGCKLESDVDSDQLEPQIDKPARWTISKLLNLAKCMCIPEIAPALDGKIKRFMDELVLISEGVETVCHEVNHAANNGILARLAAFKSK